LIQYKIKKLSLKALEREKVGNVLKKMSETYHLSLNKIVQKENFYVFESVLI
jgi:hypothetical protein